MGRLCKSKVQKICCVQKNLNLSSKKRPSFSWPQYCTPSHPRSSPRSSILESQLPGMETPWRFITCSAELLLSASARGMTPHGPMPLTAESRQQGRGGEQRAGTIQGAGGLCPGLRAQRATPGPREAAVRINTARGKCDVHRVPFPSTPRMGCPSTVAIGGMQGAAK